MARYRRKFRWSLRRIISLVLAVLMIAGAVAGIAALSKKLSDDKKTVHPTFTRGGINATTGLQVESNGSLYSEAFEAKGLEIKLDFNSKISYQVFWYDENDVFNYAEPQLTVNGTFYAPATCKARILITPLWDRIEDDDKEIAWHEVLKYVNQIKISVDKDQKIDKDAYELYEMTNSIYQVAEGTHYDPDIKGFKEEEWTTDVNTYYFTNTRFSSMYIDPLAADIGIDDMTIFVVLDDDVNCYYYSNYSSVSRDLPTAENPVYIPKGAEVYIFFNTIQVHPEWVGVYLY